MGDYTRMSAYYDLIMTSGYYDYDAIVDELVGAESDSRRFSRSAPAPGSSSNGWQPVVRT